MTSHPEVYHRLKRRVTRSGVTLAQCMKTGVDNPGHPRIKTVGLTAGDEESYTLFRELFDPVIRARHGGRTHAGHDLDLRKLSDVDMDPYNRYVLTARVRTGRSVRGFRLPPAIGFEERRQLEAVCVAALRGLGGELRGDYYPLHGSRSYAPKPRGMSATEEAELRAQGMLFQEPDSTLLLASGMARHWPDGRGVFGTESRGVFVWVSEEDHLRIVAMQGQRSGPTAAGKNLKDVFARFARACGAVEAALAAAGHELMRSPELGWVLTCPSNLGTGLRAGVLVRLPRVSARPEFPALLAALSLQARGAAGVDSAASDMWDLSNANRVGQTEVELCNTVIHGVAKLVGWEHQLGTGRERLAETAMAALLAPPDAAPKRDRASVLALKRQRTSAARPDAAELARTQKCVQGDAAAPGKCAVCGRPLVSGTAAARRAGLRTCGSFFCKAGEPVAA